MITSGKRLLAALLVLALCAGLAGCTSPLWQTTVPPPQTTAAALQQPGADSSPVPEQGESLSILQQGEAFPVQAMNAVAADTVWNHTPYMGSRLAAAADQNGDVVGWLQVPGTTIDTAIVQNPETGTNDFYLQHDFYRRVDSKGTYCADLRSSFSPAVRGGLSTNTTLYAHSFDDDPDSELFSQLKKFRDVEFARTHPYIYFSTAWEDMVWEVFAVFDTTVDLPYVWPELPVETAMQVMEVVYASSLYNYGIEITGDDKILTLSTCTYFVEGRELPQDVDNDYRFVVLARLVDPTDTWKETADLTVNPAPLGPSRQPRIDLSWIESWSS